MLNTLDPAAQTINMQTYRDKVLGCWTGKNIGGTVGAPFEGKRKTHDITFYTQDLKGNPEPNDDLDLQLVWLLAVEEKGLYHINERVLGEYWLSHITGPWNEYGVCKANMRNGLLPPLSGSCNNDVWKYSNGAWIRSEIWACLFPGSPDDAAQFAYYDSCCDHCGEGIYAEVFTATMESAAFIVDDIRRLINIGLSKIPDDCRIARSVKLACDCYDNGDDYLTAREALVKDSQDLGWFQAPANVGFVIIGLLYGEGDFGKSVCIATNCGDDTDCTAGTVGAIMGIVLGRSKLPKEWVEPIGESILTCSIDTYDRNNRSPLPKSLDELTDRVMKMARLAHFENPTLPALTSNETSVTDDYRESLTCPDAVRSRVWEQSPFELSYDLPYGKFFVEYDDGVEIEPGKEKRLTIKANAFNFIEKVMSVKLRLPEGWEASPCAEMIMTIKNTNLTEVEMTIVPGEFGGAYYHLPVEVRLSDRFNPILLTIPLQKKGSVQHNPVKQYQPFQDASIRCKCRNKAEL